MSLAKKLSGRSGEYRRPPTCVTGLWLEEQSAEDRTAFYAWLDAGKNKSILRETCEEEGLDVASSSFYRHTNNRCDCER